MKTIRMKTIMDALACMEAQVGAGEPERGHAIGDVIAMVEKLPTIEMDSTIFVQAEREIVDELLRSGTQSDMRIVGLINSLRGQVDYYRQIAEQK